MKSTRVILSIAAAGFVFASVLGIIGSNYAAKEQAGEETPQQEEGAIPSYMQSCLSCHGTDLTGGFGPNLTELTLSKEEIVDVIKNGKGQMPPKLAPGQEEKIAEYLLSIQGK